jgi:3-hydroxyanthranilate 3,4-dioxygenase
VNAKLIYEEAQYIIQVVGGPNRRTDYHINQTEEFFFQVKGRMTLKVVWHGEFQDVDIGEGEMFLLPANTPHSPQRFEDTVGLVVEQKRRPGVLDAVRWYCDQCHAAVYEEKFYLQTLDIGGALKPLIEKYYDSEELRTCNACSHVNVVPADKKNPAAATSETKANTTTTTNT